MVEYSYGAYNKYNEKEQWIRITEGCPHNCPFCYEPREIKVFGIPEIVRNDVKIMDMNLLSKPEALRILKELGEIKVNNKVVYYEMVCGIDYRFLNQEIANTLKKSRFRKIRIGWDWYYKDQLKIKDTLKMLYKAGYKPKDIMIFIICNWKISYKTNCAKLDLCKVWNVKVADCYFDGQISPNIEPVFWFENEIKEFRRKCRKHNQLVNFGMDPEYKKFKEKEQTKLTGEQSTIQKIGF
jgi:hypothetical protein